MPRRKPEPPWWHWRPIEALDKTHGQIIVYTERGYVGTFPVVSVRAWLNDPTGTAAVGGPVVTHWMPLPPPPPRKARPRGTVRRAP